MNSNELLSALEYLLQGRNIASYGVISPKDMSLLVSSNAPKAFIVNTKEYPGQHWLAVFSLDNVNYEVFDSYGNDVTLYNKHFRLFSKLKLIENCVEYQSNGSDVCGQFTLYFINRRLAGKPYCKIVEMFKVNDKNYNDNLVNRFYLEIKPFVKLKPYNSRCMSCMPKA